MDNERPSYITFGYFINEVLNESIEEIFNDNNKAIFEKDNVDLNHIYIDGSKFEANANKYSWVWKKSTEKLLEYTSRLEEYIEKIDICGTNRNSYSKTDQSATFMR